MSCGARVGWRRRGSGHHPVLEVRDAGGLDGTDLLKLHLRGPEVVEEASTVAEQYWNDVQLKLVQQSRCQVLLSDLGAAPKHDVLAAGGLPCLFERGLDSVGDEVERGPSLHLHGITRVMGENEHGVVVGRVVAPPARPLLVAPGATVDRAEHVSAHHAGPDVLARFLDYPCALVHLAALLAVGLAPGGQRNYPVVEPLAAVAERVLLALVRAGDEAVQRDRDMTPKFAHSASSVGGPPVLGDSASCTRPVTHSSLRRGSEPSQSCRNNCASAPSAARTQLRIVAMDGASPCFTDCRLFVTSWTRMTSAST